jgi:hypothetical protein
MKLRQRKKKFGKIKIVIKSRKEATILWDILEKTLRNGALTSEERDFCINLSNWFSSSCKGM